MIGRCVHFLNLKNVSPLILLVWFRFTEAQLLAEHCHLTKVWLSVIYRRNGVFSLFLQLIYAFFPAIVSFCFNSFFEVLFLGPVAAYQPSSFLPRFCSISLSPLSYKLPNPPVTNFPKGLLVPQEFIFHFTFSNTHCIPCHFSSIMSCHLYYNKSFLS